MGVVVCSYRFTFSGPERFLVMKVFERRLRRFYNVYGLELISDDKPDMKNLKFPRVSFEDVLTRLKTCYDLEAI